MKKMTDGNSAVANIAYYLSECAFIYPITPSTTMAEACEDKASLNEKNFLNNPLKIVEMQSEGGVAGALHGACLTGALTTTFTCSQGLLLMIPNMYKIAGELLPTVFHVSSRALSTHALNIFNDHSDVMATRQTGFAFLCSNNAQECQDFALASHITTIKSKVPFLHFFDGFRTSHEIEKIELIDKEDINKIIPYNEIKEFKDNSMKVTNPKQFGTAQNPDVYFQNREACNTFYNNLPKILTQTFNDIYSITNRKYEIFEYVGNKNAENVFICLGSSAEVIEEYIKNSNANLGLIKIRLFRPFDVKYFISKLPSSVKNIVVLDKTKESGSVGEPLYLDVVSALCEENIKAKVYGGRYGLGGKDFNVDMVHSIYTALIGNKIKNHFTIGINDDLTNTSLPITPYKFADNNYCCKFYGLGSDGTVSANKNSVKIIGNNSNLFAQAYFEYDSKKSGSLTTSHLRFSQNKILSHYLIKECDFIAIHNNKFLEKYDLLKDIKPNGKVLINIDENEINNLPNDIKYQLKQKNVQLYTINASKIADICNLNEKINTIMQTAFFKITDIINFDIAKNEIIESIKQTYKKFGEDVINNNIKAVEEAENNIKKIDLSLINANNLTNKQTNLSVIEQILLKNGDNVRVSQLSYNGSTDTNTSNIEKRNISNSLPLWIPEKCIQCGNCSMVCPHAVIRPILVNKNEIDNNKTKLANAIGVKNAKFVLQISPKDCTGCKNCVNACPVKEKALKMVDSKDYLTTLDNEYNYTQTLTKLDNPFNENSIKGCQFNLPYFEFSGACSGCGETPYIKLLTQLFGNRMVIANATGCSSIYSGSNPTCPYSKDSFGMGPTWASSLFEDNAEFGYGMKISLINQKLTFVKQLQDKLNDFKNEELKDLLTNWLNNYNDAKMSIEIYKSIKELISNNINEDTNLVNFIKDNYNNLIKKCVWIIGGDGWAYDIGFGGLDQVVSSGENVNILILDTEVYSNTGGQTSKSTPLGATTKFDKLGKTTNKKNLAQMLMTYKNVYVAQVAMGADKLQLIKAFKEAESYNGPSVIIAYSTCINHGIKTGTSIQQMKSAVDSGYFHLFRYNPSATKKFNLDSKEPTKDYIAHALTEKRYSSLPTDKKDEILKTAKENANKLYLFYKKLDENN